MWTNGHWSCRSERWLGSAHFTIPSEKFLTCPEQQNRIWRLRFQLSSFLCFCKELRYTNVNISLRCKECVHNYKVHFQNLLWFGRIQFVTCWPIDLSTVLWVLSKCGRKWCKDLAFLPWDWLNDLWQALKYLPAKFRHDCRKHTYGLVHSAAQALN
jgi:hypothetical protein